MARSIAIQIKYRIISRKEPMSVIAFFWEIKWACDACRIHEGVALQVLKQFLTGPAEAGVKARAMETSTINVHYEGALKSYCAILQVLPKRYGIGQNLAKLNHRVSNIRQEPLSPQNILKTVDKYAEMRISVRRKVTWGPTYGRSYPSGSKNPPILVVWAPAYDFEKLGADSRIGEGHKMPATQGNDDGRTINASCQPPQQ